MKREIIITSDGSKTIHLPEWNENYHSNHGALQEALHVFIKHGLETFKERKKVTVFEMGFGTGLNACLSIMKSKELNLELKYSGIEAYPISIEEIDTLNYEDLLEGNIASIYKQLHQFSWDNEHPVETTSFKKIHSKIEEYKLNENEFDIIYFDAFGPRVQNELWSIENFSKMYKGLKEGGFLVTYCAKGQVKRDLKSVGFEIEALPGPPGKREMTRAWKR